MTSNSSNRIPQLSVPLRTILIAILIIIQLFIGTVSAQFGGYNSHIDNRNNNNRLQQNFPNQRYGQPEQNQQFQHQQNMLQHQQQLTQQYQYQQRNYQRAVNSRNTNPALGAKFINTPVSNLNGTAGALVQIQLLQYSDPGLALPNGNTCACPQGMTCSYLLEGEVTCSFAFTIIMSAANQSVQYIASPFVLVPTSPINSGTWTTTHLVNMTTKPNAIDVFVHHLGVVINQSTGSLVNFNHLEHLDTFVISLANYQATPYGTTPNTVQTTSIGQILGTSLQLAYNVQCIGNAQGPNCDLTCTPSSYNNLYAACISVISGMFYSCAYVGSGNMVSSCTPCPYGLIQDQTECASQAPIPSEPGVSPAFRVWTIVLGCLLGVAVLFIILLVITFIAAQNNNKNAASQSRYANKAYNAPSTRALLYEEDPEWRRRKTRATTGDSGTSSHSQMYDQEPFEAQHARSNGASIARHEAHV